MNMHREKYIVKNSFLVRILLAILILFSLLVLGFFVYQATNKVVALLFLAAVILLSWKKILYGMYLVIFSLSFMFIPQLFGVINVALPEVLFFSVLAVWCITSFTKKELVLKKTRMDLPLLLIFGIVFVSGVAYALFFGWSYEISRLNFVAVEFVLRILFVNAEMILFYFLAVNILTKKDLAPVTSLLVLSISLASLMALVQFYVFGVERVTSFFEYPNFFGMFLGVLFPLSLYKAIIAKRIFYRIIPFILFFSLLLTFSRAALISAFISTVFFLIMWKEKRWMLAPFIVGVVALIAIVSITEGDVLQQRVQSIGEHAQERLDLFQASLTLTLEKPLLGHGRPRIQSNDVVYEQAHNLYVQLALEKGVVILGLFIWVFVRVFQGIRHKTGREIAFLSGVVAFLIHGLMDYSLKIFLLVFILIALLEVNRTSENLEKV
tara:strand:- start:173 stop:1483 length:1311 start_codon:yes stop_codon:yes gene_type:complete